MCMVPNPERLMRAHSCLRVWSYNVATSLQWPIILAMLPLSLLAVAVQHVAPATVVLT